MLVNNSVIAVIAFLSPALIVIAILFFFRRSNHKRALNMFGGMGIVISIILSFFLYETVPKVYLITGENKYAYCSVWGAAEYKMSTGKTIQINHSSGHLLVNDSKNYLVIEDVKYGKSPFTSLSFDVLTEYKNRIINPFEINRVSGSIDFILGEAPEKISSKSMTENKTWLHVIWPYDYEKFGLKE